MIKHDYQCSIVANITPKEALDKISRVAEWWATHVEGKSQKLNDVFTVRFGETFVTFTIVEVIPDKKVVWQVTDCYLHWLDNKTEWTDTKIVWEISSQKNATHVTMTHVGLTPDVECYNDCKVGWTGYIQKSLLKFLTQGKGLPDNF